MRAIWNEVVESGLAFPQDTPLDKQQARAFFASQSFTAVAQLPSGTIGGLYILHPNNVGRCGHIANASYAVDGALRGRHIGENWSPTAWLRPGSWAFASSSLTQLSPAMKAPFTCIRSLASFAWVSSPAGSA